MELIVIILLVLLLTGGLPLYGGWFGGAWSYNSRTYNPLYLILFILIVVLLVRALAYGTI